MKRRSLLLAAPLGWSLANIAWAQTAYPQQADSLHRPRNCWRRFRYGGPNGV